jgi:uncharacterized protein HemX
MDDVLESRFRHVLETNNWLQTHVPAAAPQQQPSAPAASATAVLSGGEGGGGKKWGTMALFAVALLAGIASIGYGVHQTSMENQNED